MMLRLLFFSIAVAVAVLGVNPLTALIACSALPVLLLARLCRSYCLPGFAVVVHTVGVDGVGVVVVELCAIFSG